MNQNPFFPSQPQDPEDMSSRNTLIHDTDPPLRETSDIFVQEDPVVCPENIDVPAADVDPITPTISDNTTVLPSLASSDPTQKPVVQEPEAKPSPSPNAPPMPNYEATQRIPYAPPGRIPLQRDPGNGPVPNGAPYSNPGYGSAPNGTPYGKPGYGSAPNGTPYGKPGYGSAPNGTPYGNPGYGSASNGSPYGNAGYPYSKGSNVPPTNFPPSGNYYSKPPKKNRSGGGLLAILIASCVLIGILSGVLITNLVNKTPDTSSPSENPPVVSTAPSSTEPNRPSATEPTAPPRETQPLATSSGDLLTLNQIYTENVPAIVGISNYSGQNMYGQSSSASSTGSGFIISDHGEILTNYHVVEGASQLSVSLYDGREYPATLIGYEAESDVALIKIEAENLPVCAIGNSDQVYVGEQIAAIGNPMGELTYSMSVGYVSAVNRFVNTDGTPINMIQVDAAINPGNSGGPVFNLYGEVIGIATAKYSGTLSGGATLEGLGFAIPINDIVDILNDLRVNGKVPDRAYMGVMVSIRTLDNATYGIDHGVYVESVEANSSAYKAGIQGGDIILKIGDAETNAYENLQQILRKYRAGDETTVTVYRSGQTITLPIVFDAKPDTTQTTTTDPQYTEPVNPTDPEGTEEDPWGTFPWEDFPWGDFGG